MSYLRPNDQLDLNNPTAVGDAIGFNPDDHIKPMMLEWWGNNLAKIKARDNADYQRAFLPIHDIIIGFIIQGKSNPLAYRDLNTFLEATPVDELSLDLLHAIVKDITPIHDKLTCFKSLIKAIRVVLVNRRGFDEATFDTLFIPAGMSLDEDSSITQE